MDPYRRYAADSPISSRNLRRLGYDLEQIKHLKKETISGQIDDGYDREALLALRAVGYNDSQAKQIKSEVDYLLRYYGCRWIIGECRITPCSAWRAERLQIGEESYPRFANRIHIFERTSSGEAGRYVGYVTLRPLSKATADGYMYTTVANLVLPRHMLRPRYHVIQCIGGTPDGILPLRCVPFCIPNEDTRNHASCLHAAVHQALLLKTNAFGFNPITSLDMVTLLWQNEWASEGPSKLSLSQVAKERMTLLDALKVLKHEQVNAGGVVETFFYRDYNNSNQKRAEVIAQLRQDACRRMMDYLANGLPLIVALQVERSDEPGKKIGHSVLVCGMHILHAPEIQSDNTHLSLHELPDRFVLHNLTDGPFTEMSVQNLLKAAWEDRPDGNSGISFLAVAPVGTNTGISKVQQMAPKILKAMGPLALWKSYRQKVGIPQTAKVSNEPNYIVRLLKTQQLVHRYLIDAASGQTIANEEVTRWLNTQNTGFFWAVELRLPYEFATHKYAGGELPPAVIIVWNIADDPIKDPSLQMQYSRSIVSEDSSISEEYQMAIGDTLGRAYRIQRHRA